MGGRSDSFSIARARPRINKLLLLLLLQQPATSSSWSLVLLCHRASAAAANGQHQQVQAGRRQAAAAMRIKLLGLASPLAEKGDTAGSRPESPRIGVH